MKDLVYGTDDLIVALATGWVESALAVIRTTGSGCIEAMAPYFSRPQALIQSPGGQVLYGHLKNLKNEILDEVTLGIYRSPKSYTGQDSVEIFCHGSLPGIKGILQTLTDGPFRNAGPGEFTLRAFLNRKMDLTRAEAVAEVVRSKSSRAQSLALHRLSGGIEERINKIKEKLLNLVSALNIQLDYAEDDVEDQDLPLGLIETIAKDIRSLAGTYETGRVFQEGVKVVLAGRTNAGKSSLFNLFLKEDRSIVSEEHGTTRDYLESWVSVGGIPIRLFDTAGLREAENLVEKEGIKRSVKLMENAGAILYLVDGQAGPDPEDRVYLDKWKTDSRLIRVWNKSDLTPPPDSSWIGLSTLNGQGFHDLEKALEAVVLGNRILAPGEPVIDSLRQKQLLDRAAGAMDQVGFGAKAGVSVDMIALDVRDALDALGEITGEVTTADILNHMFSQFCVGK